MRTGAAPERLEQQSRELIQKKLTILRQHLSVYMLPEMTTRMVFLFVRPLYHSECTRSNISAIFRLSFRLSTKQITDLRRRSYFRGVE